jgi:hypothetical protein
MNPSSGQTRRWFYVREGRRLGPVDTDRLVDLVLSGEVSEEALVWHSGLTEWLRAREIEEIRHELPPPVPAAPPPPAPELPEGPENPRIDPPGSEANADAVSDGSSPGLAEGALSEAPGDDNGHRRRRKRKHRHRDASKRRPTWLWPLVVVLVALMVFLWWLLRRMNEVPPGRIIQTGSYAGRAPSGGGRPLDGFDVYRVALGREPSVSSSVTSCPARFTTTVTLSPGFLSPSA